VKTYSAISISAACIALASPTLAQTSVPPSITTPHKVETRLGTLNFKDGVPSEATAEKVFDNLDFTYAANQLQASCPAQAEQLRWRMSRLIERLNASGCS
jgi:hypothetical protein